MGCVHSVHGRDEGGGLPPVAVLLRILLKVALRVVAVLLLGDYTLGVHAELLQRALELVILLPQLPETRWTNQKPAERSRDLCRPIRGQYAWCLTFNSNQKSWLWVSERGIGKLRFIKDVRRHMFLPFLSPHIQMKIK